MNIAIALTRDPIRDEEVTLDRTGCGAVVEFRGVVRGREDERGIAGLLYEAYSPMAEKQMKRIIFDLNSEFPCHAVSVCHRLGSVPAGEDAILVRVAAAHRAEALAFLAAFMDRLKQDVPIWKVGVF